MIWLYLILVGLSSGLLAGLFGVSGGVIVIPFLVVLLPKMGFGPENLMHVAIATSLATMCVTSISSSMSHHKKRSVDWRLLRSMWISIVIGAALGASIAKLIPSSDLKVIFAVFELSIGIYMMTQKGEELPVESKLKKRSAVCVGFMISTVSALLGIGGGVFMVPALTFFRVPIRKAIGTSAATSFLIAFMGTLSFIAFGFLTENENPLAYIDLPAFLALSSTSVICVPLGTRLSHMLPIALLRRFFGLFLALLGGYLLRVCA